MTDIKGFSANDILRSLAVELHDGKKAKRWLVREAAKLRLGLPKTVEKYGFSSAKEARAEGKRIFDELQNPFGEDHTVDVSELEDTVDGEFVYTREEKAKTLETIASTAAARRKRKNLFDILRGSATYICSFLTLAFLIGIIVYCFSTGWSTLSWRFITGDYAATTYNVTMEESDKTVAGSHFEYETGENEYFSSRWGVAFVDATKDDGSEDMQISYIAEGSPVQKIRDRTTDIFLNIETGTSVSVLSGIADDGTTINVFARNGAERAAYNFDRMAYIRTGTISIGGNGIRGPLVTTLWMILFALLLAVPFGVGGAIYLSVYAKPNGVTRTIRAMIDMISGIPSIIFGLAGAIIFIPVFTGGGAIGNVLSGSATLACMVLPTIIKSTQEAIDAIPRSMKNASLALGASQTQTVFKVILPNSIPGILTGALLAIGRIIGESAALVFACGVSIQDTVDPTTQSAASLAVYIWKVMSGEAPNYKAASATAILILIVVLVLNISVKLLASRFDKFTPKGPKSFYRKIYDNIKKKWEVRKENRQRILMVTRKENDDAE